MIDRADIVALHDILNLGALGAIDDFEQRVIGDHPDPDIGGDHRLGAIAFLQRRQQFRADLSERPGDKNFPHGCPLMPD